MIIKSIEVPLVFKLADLEVGNGTLPSLIIELTEEKGFILTFIIDHAFPAQVLEQCNIGSLIKISVGKLSADGTVESVELREGYSKIVLINLLGII
jgi:hypothetical protein